MFILGLVFKTTQTKQDLVYFQNCLNTQYNVSHVSHARITYIDMFCHAIRIK